LTKKDVEMTRLLLLTVGIFLSLTVSAQTPVMAENTVSLSLMPYPQQATQQVGELVLGKQWLLAVEGKKSAELKAALKRFSQRTAQQTGIKIRWKKAAADKATLIIRLKDSGSMSARISDWDESYSLIVSNKNISLEANQQLGVLRGLETLLQLIGTA